MADKTIIVEIQYDTSQAIKNVENYTQTIEGAKVAQAQLKAELEAGKISQKEYSIAVETSKQEQSKANAERKSTIQLLGSEKGSINELRANIKTLTAERNSLNLNTSDGQKRLVEINKTLDAHNEVIKKSADGYLKQKLNIGNYSEALSALPGPLGGVVSGIGSMTKATLAFIATPLGMVIAAISAALGALIGYFKGSEEGQNKLNKILNVGKAIFEALMDVVENIGEALYNAVTKPKEAWQSFKDMIAGIGDFFKNTFGNIIMGSITVFVGGLQ
jgi:hypothetical protein